MGGGVEEARLEALSLSVAADFKAFFEAVQRAAREHGVAAHVVCAAVRGTGANVQVGSSAHAPGFTYGEQKILSRCLDVMEESLDVTLGQLEAEKQSAALN